MSKPVTVPEDEALKYYRVKNLTMPPEAFELTDLDREMSSVLSRTDLSPKEKAFQYYRSLTKFRNLYKQFLPSIDEPQDEEEVKYLDASVAKEIEKVSDEKNIVGSVRNLFPSEVDSESENDKTIAMEEGGDESEKEEDVSENEKGEDESESESEVETLKVTKKPPSSNQRKLKSYLNKDGKRMQNLILQRTKSRKSLGVSEKGVSFLQNRKKKSFTFPIWGLILNFLGSKKLEPIPSIGEPKRKKLQATVDIAQFFLNNKIIDKHQYENFPNFANILESANIRKSFTPMEFAPKLTGNGINNIDLGFSGGKLVPEKMKGVKVNFKQWNNHLL